MLTLIALSAVLTLQEPPPPPTPPEVRTHVFLRGADGPGALDKDGDGQVSREEFAAPLNAHFAEMDKDGDGRLSTGELAPAPSGSGDQEFTIMSGPGGPGVRHFQMRRPAPGAEGGPPEERQEHVIVLNGRGEPGGPGMTLDMREGGDRHVEIRRVGGDGDDLDADKDGKVSEAEFTAPLREAFYRMDKDRSGYIEAGERGGDGEARVFTHRMETRRDRED